MPASLTQNQLQSLYREAGRPDDLFPVFERTRSFRSWIVVFALIPSLYALQHATLSEIDSEWLLRGMDLLSANTLDGVVCPGGGESRADIKYQPPMGTWLSAAVVRFIPGTSLYEALVASWLGTGFLIAGLYWLSRDLFGERVGLWCGMLAAGQLIILQQAQSVAPHALGVCTGLLSIRAFARHVDHEESVITWQILAAGLLLGLCLLFSGPLAIAVMICQLTYCLAQTWQRASDRSRRIPMVAPSRRFLSLALLWTTCLAAAGWWPMMMASAYGEEFWLGWFHGPSGGQSLKLSAMLGWNLLEELGPIAGLAAIGLVQTAGACWSSRNRGDLVLATWLVSAAAWWILTVAVCRNGAMLPEASRLLLVCGLIACAARALNDVSRGTLRVLTAAVVTLLPMAVSYGRDLISADDIVPLLLSSAGLLMLIFLLFIFVCLMNRDEFSAHAQPRLYAGVFLALLIGANFRTGFASLTASRTLDSAEIQGAFSATDLSRLRKSLGVIPVQIDSILLLTDRRETARLRLELVNEFPSSQVVEIGRWRTAYERMNSDRDSGSVVVIEWGAFPQELSHGVPEGWLRQTIGRVRRFNGADMLIHHFVRVAARPK